MSYLFLQVQAQDVGNHFPLAFTLVYVVGFIAAITIGSIAWYNSKRPPGWLKVWPHQQDMDGFFMVRLRKTNDSE